MAFDGDTSGPGWQNWATDGVVNMPGTVADKADEIKDAINPLPEARSALVSLGLLAVLAGVLYMVTK